MGEGGTHPRYRHWAAEAVGTDTLALIGDEVALATVTNLEPLGVVTAVYLESVELSTGDQSPVADLALLRRAEA